MTGQTPLSSFNRSDIEYALKKGVLEISLGVFTARAKGDIYQLTDFICDTYRDVMVRLDLSDVTDISLDIRAPSILRKFIRPQVIPDPGFHVPAIPLPSSMAGLAFEMGMNLVVALKCSRFVTFHAGVVANEKGAILMSAESGGGKSTLTAALMEEGYALFSDEFGLLSMDDTKIFSYPRPISLKNESIDIVSEIAGEEWITPTLKDTPKGKIAYRRVRPSDIAAAKSAVPVKLIIFPRFEAGAAPHTQPLSAPEAIMRLIPSSTNYHMLGESAFRALMEMVKGAKAYQITYGSTEYSLSLVRELAVEAGL